MNVVRGFGQLRTIASRRILRRAAFVGGLAFVERALTLGAVWSFFTASLRLKLLLAGFLGLTIVARNLAQVAFSSRTEADLLDRVTTSLLHGDVLQAMVLGGEDPHAELAQALYGSSQYAVRDVPLLAADSAICFVLAILTIRYESSIVVVSAVSLLGLAAGAAAWSRAHMQRSLERIWELERCAIASLVDALEGRLEIVASGRRQAFIDIAKKHSKAWSDAATRRAAGMALLGRLPLLGIGAVVLLIAGLAARRGVLPDLQPVDMGLLATALPALSGTAFGLLAVVRGERWVSLVSKIVASARLATATYGVTAQGPPSRVSVEGVSFRYGAALGAVDALHAVSVSWTGERIVAFAGPNGSGKSTLLRLLLGLSEPCAGHVVIDGQDLFQLDLDRWRAGIGFLAQRPYLPQRASIRDAVRLLVPSASDAQIAGSLERSGLLESVRHERAHPLDVCVDALSTGQRQRVAIARLLCMDSPRMILLDEPDAGLDVAGIGLVADLVRDLARTRPVVFAAHSPVLLGAAERVIVLDAGRVVRDERAPEALRLSTAT